ncbi:MAG TPA: D-alanyl-D-alanine carboxypeptidase/D-alanyl-D-alanine-endopeptidase [Candidatus Eremiobacteraceae bacterium]|nr:D-alanyl-D-alanine carboxypeptidase/D-alanyl-D-alanine-endopeptidase [Candidatus Eremiobacteraceae bacterium]
MAGRPPRYYSRQYVPRSVARKRRRRIIAHRLRLLLALVVFIVIATFGIRALRSTHGIAPSAAPTPAVPTAPPFTSAFVRNGKPWGDADRARVIGAAAPIVNGAAFPATTGAIIMDAHTGRILYEHDEHQPLVPASTLKVVVAATALHDLGPSHRFETQIVTDGAIRDGQLDGDLYLVGGGDPELATDDLRGAVHRMKAEGISVVSGAVVSDGSLYGPDAVNKTWDAEDLEYGWAAPPSAITIDNGAVQFTLTPDADGGLATLQVDPPGAAGKIVGGVRSVSEDADNTLRIDPLPDGSGYAISGQLPYGAPQKYWRSIAKPTAVAANVLRTMAFSDGIAIAGDASTGKAPAGASTTLWTHLSRPLSGIIQRMALDSDNHIAEQLLRAVGANDSGTGTLDNGLAAEHAFLASIGADDPHNALVDGSGLSAADYVTAATLAAALRSMLSGSDAQAEAALLPRVGLEGTVQYRPLASDVLGRVRGKDGYIEGASGLAGYVETAHHGVVVYAFLVDNWQLGLDAIWAGEDEILARLARM